MFETAFTIIRLVWQILGSLLIVVVGGVFWAIAALILLITQGPRAADGFSEEFWLLILGGSS